MYKLEGMDLYVQARVYKLVGTGLYVRPVGTDLCTSLCVQSGMYRLVCRGP